MTTQELNDFFEISGYTVSEVAGSLGVSRQTVSRWRAGKLPVPPWLIKALIGIEALERGFVGRWNLTTPPARR